MFKFLNLFDIIYLQIEENIMALRKSTKTYLCEGGPFNHKKIRLSGNETLTFSMKYYSKMYTGYYWKDGLDILKWESTHEEE